MDNKEALEIQCDFEQRVNDARCMSHMVASPDFVQLYEISSKEEREKLKGILKDIDKLALKDWIQFHPSKPIDSWPVTRLKELAYQYGVKNYSRMRKDELAREVQMRRKHK